MITKEEVIAFVEECISEEELESLNRILVEKLKNVRKIKSYVATSKICTMEPGSQVFVKHWKTGRIVAATLVKVNSTRVKVRFPDDLRLWSVPANLVSATI